MDNKKETLNEAKQRAANYMSLKGALEPKQEILEETAKRIYGSDASKDVEYYAFINGAKWQQERSYSEEDMAEAFIACWKANVPDGIECKVSFNEWFEQFKKKQYDKKRSKVN